MSKPRNKVKLFGRKLDEALSEHLPEAEPEGDEQEEQLDEEAGSQEEPVPQEAEPEAVIEPIPEPVVIAPAPRAPVVQGKKPAQHVPPKWVTNPKKGKR